MGWSGIEAERCVREIVMRCANICSQVRDSRSSAASQDKEERTERARVLEAVRLERSLALEI